MADAFAEAGPGFAQVAKLGPIDWPAWRAAADRLAGDLTGAPDIERRIHHLYLPVLFFCAACVRASATRPVLVGIQAPQGAGKTTLVTHLLALLPALGLRGAGVSIDDFYLTRAEQLRLAAAHPGNRYLEHRGYPGTHDIELGEQTLRALKRPDMASQGVRRPGLSGPASGGPERSALRSETRSVRVPVYDKSLHGGRGDRAPEAEWRDVTGPLDVVFVEGWMLGFAPVPDGTLDDPDLVAPNRALAAYDRWHRLLDAFVVLRAIDPSSVLRWRVDAEAAMVARGRPGLDRAAIEDYVRRFLPAYARYGGAPACVPRDRRLEIWLDEGRGPTRRT
jgi:D-glycerate 3-kinase